MGYFLCKFCVIKFWHRFLLQRYHLPKVVGGPLPYCYTSVGQCRQKINPQDVDHEKLIKNWIEIVQTVANFTYALRVSHLLVKCLP